MAFRKKAVPNVSSRKWYVPTGRDISDFVITAGVSLGIEFLPHMENVGFAERATMASTMGMMYGIGISRGAGIKRGARSGFAALKGAAFGSAVGYVLRQYTDVI